MIVHESRNSAFRRPFGAAETGTEVYLAAEKAGAADMTLRLHPFTGEDTNYVVFFCPFISPFHEKCLFFNFYISRFRCSIFWRCSFPVDII